MSGHGTQVVTNRKEQAMIGWRTLVGCLVLVWVGSLSALAAERNTGPWNLTELKQTPAATFGEADGLVQPVFYAGEPYQNRPTRVFAWYGRPKGDGPFPGVVLVHGGGGKAFREWAQHWAERGYAALAMDLAGNGPDGRLPDGGPDQGDDTKFRPFDDSTLHDMWTYHAVAAVVRGHSLLAAQPGVDRERIGITGISWGGYLTCIVTGIDDRLKGSVPVYGCGYLADNSVWLEPRFQPMTAEQRAQWVRLFDPSQYLAGVSCSTLFLNGTNDFAYPLDSYRKSYSLVPEKQRMVAVIPRLPHGHIWTFPEVDLFLDSQLREGTGLARLGALQTEGGRVSATVKSPTELREALLHYTTDGGAWQNREWKSIPAKIEGETVSAELPGTGPLVYYLAVKDARGVTVSTAHGER